MKNYDEDFFDLREIFSAVKAQKKLFFSILLFFAIFSVIFALSIPNLYQSKAVLVPSADENNDSALARYRGLGAIAGINMPVDEVSKSMEGIERFKSFDFFKTLIDTSFKREDILATNGWDPKTNTLYYIDSLYDSESGNWVRKVRFPKKQIPSDQEAFERFEDAFSVFIDEETGFIHISVEHHSPNIAKDWLTAIIFSLNELMRNEDKLKAQKSLEYLNYQIANTNLTEIKQVLSLLIQKQIETLTLIESNEEYVFKIIDSPIAPEKKISPSRAIICIFITFFGGVVALLAAFWRYRKSLS
tara:strand:- start:661 stop:1566 length:906 start_codon:yes stop_codon:yes gene_type:complete